MKSDHLLLPFADPTLDSLLRNTGSGRCSPAKTLWRPGYVENRMRRRRLGIHVRLLMIHLSIFRSSSPVVPVGRWLAKLAASPARVPPLIDPRRARAQRPADGWILRAVALVLLLLAPAPGPARPNVLRIPFRNVDSMILVHGKVNGNDATFLLDTGSNRTIVDGKVYGYVQFELQRTRRNDLGPGVRGQSVRLTADVEIANHLWISQSVSVMNLDELAKVLGLRFDGLIGQDLLRQFRSVRIDYRAHVIELEQ